MLDLFNLPTPQGCNIQTFYGSGVDGTANSPAAQKTWIKPRGVSNIYMLLIGSGGTGDGTFGGASGSVTVWYGSAIHVPDSLVISVSAIKSGSNAYASTVSARFPNSGLAPTALLTAASAASTSTGGAMTANQFAASGFFQSVNGISGPSTDPGASSTTFVQPGGGTTGVNTANYGYVTNSSGSFQLQPIIVSLGGAGAGRGGIGSGGGASSGVGGSGLVLIASW